MEDSHLWVSVGNELRLGSYQMWYKCTRCGMVVISAAEKIVDKNWPSCNLTIVKNIHEWSKYHIHSWKCLNCGCEIFKLDKPRPDFQIELEDPVVGLSSRYSCEEIILMKVHLS